jgi:hypothetical protein
VIAHIGGLPVEEVLPVLMSGGGAWLILRLRRTFTPRSAPPAVRCSADSAGDEHDCGLEPTR